MQELTGGRTMRARECRNMRHVMTMLRALAFGYHPGWRRVAITMLLVFGLCSHVAFAQTASCTGAGVTVITVSMPAAITVPRDAPNGTVLTSWVTTPNNTYYNCAVTGSATSGVVFEPLSLTTAGLTVAGPNGVAYTVWKTNIPGIGIAIGVHPFVNGCGFQPWQDLGRPTGGGFPSPWVGTGCNANGAVTNGGQVQMALVKTGTITAGTVTGDSLFEVSSYTRLSGSSPLTIATTGRKAFSLASTAVSVAGCTTADVTLDMGSYMRSKFTGIGSVSNPAKTFSIAVNACPSGLAKIQYQFIPVNAVLDATNGVLALSSTSTATGIGLQLKDNSGVALKYNTQYTLSGYNTATGGSYTIPLSANYYQTATTVTPGSANAVLTFTLTYQ